jgi:O-antigen ligase
VPNHAVTGATGGQTLGHTPLDPLAIAVYLMTFAIVAVLATRRPAYGIAALIVLVPFALYRYVGDTTLTLSKVALVANVAGLIAGRRTTSALRGPAAVLFLACGAAVAAATALSIVHAAHRGPVVRETLKAIEYLLLFATVVVAANADSDERPIGVACSLVVVLAAMLAIAQEWTGAPSALLFHGHIVPRVAGPLEGPNQLAGFLGIALCVVCAFALRRGATAYELAALAVGTGALVLTLSRTGVIAAAIAIATVFAVGTLAPRRSTALALGCGLVAGVALLGASGYAATHDFGILSHFSTSAEAERPGSVGNRSELWRAAFLLWREHPVFGIGAGNFELELGLAGYPGLKTHANSLYLQALVEGGIPLFLATLALVVASIARFARGPFSQPLVVGAFAASLGFGLHQIFDLLVFYPKVGELWWIVLALGAVRFDSMTSADRLRSRPGDESAGATPTAAPQKA